MDLFEFWLSIILVMTSVLRGPLSTNFLLKTSKLVLQAHVHSTNLFHPKYKYYHKENSSVKLFVPLKTSQPNHDQLASKIPIWSQEMFVVVPLSTSREGRTSLVLELKLKIFVGDCGVFGEFDFSRVWHKKQGACINIFGIWFFQKFLCICKNEHRKHFF